jgi:hypothetical protein
VFSERASPMRCPGVTGSSGWTDSCRRDDNRKSPLELAGGQLTTDCPSTGASPQQDST